MARALATGEIVTAEDMEVETPGGRRTILNYARPICDEAGRITAGVAVNVDITARKQAEQTRALLAAIVESTEDAVLSNLGRLSEG